MQLIVCVEENGGMSFCGRRLVFDREVTAHILQITSGKKLWMNRYSAGLFPEQEIVIDEVFLEKADQEDYCFLENTSIPEDLSNVASVIVYRWNRRYPSTVKFPRTFLDGKKLVETVEFPGYSHDKITMERYQS
jgi:hypothetical protein